MVFLSRAILLGALFAPVALASPAEAAPRHYDCSKPGNANKAACKAAPATKVARAKPAKAAKGAKPVETKTTKITTTTTERHYDCTKAGNANKAQCRTAAKETPAGKTSGAVTKTTKTTATTTDCTKWYNRLRATCRTTSSSSPQKTTVAPASKPAAAKPRGRNAPTGGSGETVNNTASGAIAQCKDGGYSHAAHRSGACSRHGGVAKWLAG
jgi:Protein of unknown function (DUF3761)